MFELQGHRRAVYLVFGQRNQQVFLVADVRRDGVHEASAGDSRSVGRVVAGRIEGMRARAAGPAQVFVSCSRPAASGIREQIVVHPQGRAALDACHIEGADGSECASTGLPRIDHMDDERFSGLRRSGNHRLFFAAGKGRRNDQKSRWQERCFHK